MERFIKFCNINSDNGKILSTVLLPLNLCRFCIKNDTTTTTTILEEIDSERYYTLFASLDVICRRLKHNLLNEVPILDLTDLVPEQ